MMQNTPLSRIQSWFQRLPLLHSRRALLLLGGTFLIVLFLFRIITRSSEQILTPPALQSPTGSEGTITLTNPRWPEYPDSLPSYRVTAFTRLEQGVAAWANQIGLQQFTQSTNPLYTNADRTQILTVSPGNQGVTYRNSTLAPQEDEHADLDVAKIHLEQFLKQLGFTSSQFIIVEKLIAPNPDDIEESIVTMNPADAITIQFELTQKINDAPLRWEAGGIQHMIVTASNRGVYHAVITNFPLQYEQGAMQKTLSSNQVQKNIEAGGYVIVGTVGSGAERAKLVSLEVNDSELEYRVSTSEQSVKPYLRLTGTGSFQDGKTFPVQITTPLTQ